MRFETTGLDGAWLVHLEPKQDSRGFFARTFCVNEFRAQGLETDFPQHSISRSFNKGTVRGMHFQREPHAEVKLVRCLSGVIWDAIIDLRPNSPTFRQWRAFDASSGVCHDDPAFGITWPLPVTTISEKDLLWPKFGA
jgi:dTDP-4-dehydrorhamnose 3,5-epimerase